LETLRLPFKLTLHDFLSQRCPSHANTTQGHIMYGNQNWQKTILHVEISVQVFVRNEKVGAKCSDADQQLKALAPALPEPEETHLPPGNQTWQLKIPHLWMLSSIKTAI